MNTPHDDERLEPRVTDLADAEAAALLRHLGDPAPAAVDRVRRALVRSTTRAVAAERPWFAAAVGGLSGAVLVGLGMWIGPQLVGERVVPVARALDADREWRSESLGDDVAVSFQGAGEVEGDSAHPRIQWDRGVIHVEVEPDRGVNLAVETREASVRVVGTGFSVARDALGTQVEVQHGRVEVVCAGQPGVFLGVGDTRECLPTSAGGMLGRARALEAAGAGSDAVLDAVGRGLSLVGESSGAVRDELSVMRVHHLLASGASEAAIDAGRTYLAGADRVRAIEVTRMVAAAELAVGGCPRALASLEAAAVLPGADEDDTTARDACRAQLAAQ